MAVKIPYKNTKNKEQDRNMLAIEQAFDSMLRKVNALEARIEALEP